MPYYSYFVAIASLYVFREIPRWRTAISLGLVGLIAFQAGGALATIRQNLVSGVVREVASLVNASLVASRRETVMAPSQFGFYFGFDRVKDDRTSRYIVTDRPLYAIIPTVPAARIDDVAEAWAPAVNAALRDCYTPPEVIRTYKIYRRKEGCGR
jgi:hypothetical protein